jgi:putative flavoprotein involved in K+ transport
MIEIGQPARVPLRLDLRERGITSVLWATGFRRAYPWLRVPVLDPTGEILQWRGSTPVPGLYVLGQRFQHHRNSNLIDGVGRDATTVADDVVRKRCTTS